MSETMTKAAFEAWEVQQPVAFELIDGRPVRLPEDRQGSSRLARVRQLAMKALGDEGAVSAWMRTPQVELGGLEPEALAARNEEGCQLALKALLRLGRHSEAAHG